ncbi:uncharacterized protein LOC114280169 [Camellia sinensis]|uniref:uncharacterized protein LOC114280169 n=1 Tax=Camellia sinensis TaxID=4442 RepID=UPI001036103C|nr:uncharacterized protein LOC114280169 [Camellia sinensis]
MERESRELENGYHRQVNDYQPQMPFTFRHQQEMERESRELENGYHRQVNDYQPQMPFTFRHQQEMERESRELENGYHRQVNDYQPQMPFTFRVQPIQPNLLVDILEKYHQQSGKRLWDAKHENLSNELDRIKKENDSLQIELRHLKGEDITSLQPRDLMAIENTLETGLESVRYKQSEIHRMMKKNGKMLEEDNKQLNLILHQQEMERESRELENGYHRQVNDYQPQMPFTFRVQPIQPNLHERIPEFAFPVKINKYIFALKNSCYAFLFFHFLILFLSPQHQQEMERESRELENGYHRQVNDYQPQMPFTFRVQPIQPNLHERI